MPGVITPMMVKRPMMPKMKAPSRMRIGQGGRSGSIASNAEAHRARRRRSCRAAGSVAAPSSSATIAPHAALDAAVEVVALELRRHLVADDAARHRVRQRAFEAVADLDAHLAVLRRDDDEHAVVLALLAELPCVEHPLAYSSMLSPPIVGTVSTAIWFVVRSSCCFERLAEALARRRREDLGVVDDAAGQVRTHRPRARAAPRADAATSQTRAGLPRAHRYAPRVLRSARPRTRFAAVARVTIPLPASRSPIASSPASSASRGAARRAAAPSSARSRASHSAAGDRVAQAGVGEDDDAPLELATSTRIAVRVLVAKSCRSRNCTFAYCRTSSAARVRAGRVAQTRARHAQRARTARRRPGLRPSTSAIAALVTQSGRTMSPTRTTSAAATRRARRPSTRSRDTRRTCRRRSSRPRRRGALERAHALLDRLRVGRRQVHGAARTTSKREAHVDHAGHGVVIVRRALAEPQPRVQAQRVVHPVGVSRRARDSRSSRACESTVSTSARPSPVPRAAGRTYSRFTSPIARLVRAAAARCSRRRLVAREEQPAARRRVLAGSVASSSPKPWKHRSTSSQPAYSWNRARACAISAEEAACRIGNGVKSRARTRRCRSSLPGYRDASSRRRATTDCCGSRTTTSVCDTGWLRRSTFAS